MKKLNGGTLAVDIGGSGIKAMVLDGEGVPISERRRIQTPENATPEAVIEIIVQLAQDQPPFERVSIGFPGVVMENQVHTAPNLDGDWAGVALGGEVEKRVGRPVRVANDAGVQGLGMVEGKGIEMVLTLGTGMGSALYLDGRLIPLELGHHPFNGKNTYEEYVGKAALKKVGTKRWNKRVREVVEQIQPIWNPRLLHLGGGHAAKLSIELPKNVRIGDNVSGLLGGIRLWM